MSHLSGNFAGMLRIQCPEETYENLLSSLRSLENLTVSVSEELPETGHSRKIISFDVIGNDRPGIIQELASAIVKTGGNVEELSSHLESAPHAGHPVFKATGTVTVKEDFNEQGLIEALEGLGADLAVSIEHKASEPPQSLEPCRLFSGLLCYISRKFERSCFPPSVRIDSG